MSSRKFKAATIISQSQHMVYMAERWYDYFERTVTGPLDEDEVERQVAGEAIHKLREQQHDPQ